MRHVNHMIPTLYSAWMNLVHPCSIASVKVSNCYIYLSYRDGLQNIRHFWHCLLKKRHVHCFKEFVKAPFIAQQYSQQRSITLAYQTLYMKTKVYVVVHPHNYS